MYEQGAAGSFAYNANLGVSLCSLRYYSSSSFYQNKSKQSTTKEPSMRRMRERNSVASGSVSSNACEAARAALPCPSRRCRGGMVVAVVAAAAGPKARWIVNAKPCDTAKVRSMLGSTVCCCCCCCCCKWPTAFSDKDRLRWGTGRAGTSRPWFWWTGVEAVLVVVLLLLRGGLLLWLPLPAPRKRNRCRNPKFAISGDDGE